MSPSASQPSPGAWARVRDDLKQEISRRAMALFLARGYDAVTVEEIAREVGISRRSLFRYFGTKEDVVLGGLTEQGHAVLAALRARPDDEEPWQALGGALADATADVPRGQMLEQARMYVRTPSLRSSHLAKQLDWQHTLAPEIARRLDPAQPARAELPANAIVACVLACLHAATEAWVEGDGQDDLERLYRDAVAAVRRVDAPPARR